MLPESCRVAERNTGLSPHFSTSGSRTLTGKQATAGDSTPPELSPLLPARLPLLQAHILRIDMIEK